MSDRSTAHIVPVPGYVTILRIVEIVLSILVLALAANTIDGFSKVLQSTAATSAATEPLGFIVFCCIWTWLVNAYLIATPLYMPVAYNMWAHLALEIISWIFWLAGWASTASWAADWAKWFDGATGKVLGRWATGAAAAGLGALIWIIVTVTLVVFALRLKAFREDPANPHASGLGLAEKGGESHQMGSVPPQHVPAQQQTPVYPDSTSTTPVQYGAPTPVQYGNTPPPQQWQQSPPPQQQY